MGVNNVGKETGRDDTTKMAHQGTIPPHCKDKDCSRIKEEEVRQPYRVFISYSHADRELADGLEKHLILEGLFPIKDSEIRIGEAFSEEIREMIECAHVFMPLVTESAKERNWVQQEIGYATALHVPVFPITVLDKVEGMFAHIQGLCISAAKAEDAKSPGESDDTSKVTKAAEEKAVPVSDSPNASQTDQDMPAESSVTITKENNIDAAPSEEAISDGTAEKTDKAPQDVKKILEEIRSRLDYKTVCDLVRRAQRRPRTGRYSCAMSWAERQQILAELTEDARNEGCRLNWKIQGIKEQIKKEAIDLEDEEREAVEAALARRVNINSWRLRQRTTFGSFSLPDANATNKAWEVRDHDRYQTQYECQLLRRERQAMEAYTKCFGCDLILYPRFPDRKRMNWKKWDFVSVPEDDTKDVQPGNSQSGSGYDAHEESADSESNEKDKRPYKRAMGSALKMRLVLEFVTKHYNTPELSIVIPDGKNIMNTNLFVVGDWFATEAVLPATPSATYDLTMFTRHAPTVLNMIDRFEQDFSDFLPEEEDVITAIGVSKKFEAILTLEVPDNEQQHGSQNAGTTANEDDKREACISSENPSVAVRKKWAKGIAILKLIIYLRFVEKMLTPKQVKDLDPLCQKVPETKAIEYVNELLNAKD